MGSLNAGQVSSGEEVISEEPNPNSSNPSKNPSGNPSKPPSFSFTNPFAAAATTDVSFSSSSIGKCPSNSATCPNSLSFRENVVPHEHFHVASPRHCFTWLLKSESTAKLFFRHRSHDSVLGQWLLLKWFLRQSTDFNGLNFLCVLLRLHPSKGHENRVAFVRVSPRALLTSASGVLNSSPWARMCILRLASRVKPFPHTSQKWRCCTRSSIASSSTTLVSSLVRLGESDVGVSESGRTFSEAATKAAPLVMTWRIAVRISLDTMFIWWCVRRVWDWMDWETKVWSESIRVLSWERLRRETCRESLGKLMLFLFGKCWVVFGMWFGWSVGDCCEMMKMMLLRWVSDSINSCYICCDMMIVVQTWNVMTPLLLSIHAARVAVSLHKLLLYTFFDSFYHFIIIITIIVNQKSQ